MLQRLNRSAIRQKKHYRIRHHLAGTTERPRLNVFRSLNHMYAQIIDDGKGITLVAASTRDTDLNGKLTNGGNQESAKLVGALIAEKALAKGISKVVFDRGGYLYHGRVAVLAEAAREAGLDF